MLCRFSCYLVTFMYALYIYVHWWVLGSGTRARMRVQMQAKHARVVWLVGWCIAHTHTVYTHIVYTHIRHTHTQHTHQTKGVEVSIMRSVINESQAPANFLHFKFHLCNSQNSFNIIDRFKPNPIFSFASCHHITPMRRHKVRAHRSWTLFGWTEFNFVS